MMITVDVLINSNIEKVWQNWSDPAAVMVWNHASEDWYCPQATNDFRPGGSFNYTMSSIDDKNSFNFTGMYTKVDPPHNLDVTLSDGRLVSVNFEAIDSDNTIVTESFDTEADNPVDFQRQGWQAILNNFKKYCETN